MPKLDLPDTFGKFTRLRLLEKQDLEMIRAWRNKPRARRWFNFSEPVTRENHRIWYENYRQSPDDYMFILEDLERKNLPVAVAGVYNFNWETGSAEIGRFVVGEDSALGTKVINDIHPAMFRLFEQRGLAEFRAQVKENNHLALRMFFDLGYKLCATENQMVYLTYGNEVNH